MSISQLLKCAYDDGRRCYYRRAYGMKPSGYFERAVKMFPDVGYNFIFVYYGDRFRKGWNDAKEGKTNGNKSRPIL